MLTWADIEGQYSTWEQFGEDAPYWTYAAYAHYMRSWEDVESQTWDDLALKMWYYWLYNSSLEWGMVVDQHSQWGDLTTGYSTWGDVLYINFGETSGSGFGVGTVSGEAVQYIFGSASGSGIGSSFISAPSMGVFGVNDDTVVSWFGGRSSTAIFQVDDTVEVAWMGYQPPNPAPENLDVFIHNGGLRSTWDSPFGEFVLERERWIGAGSPPP